MRQGLGERDASTSPRWRQKKNLMRIGTAPIALTAAVGAALCLFLVSGCATPLPTVLTLTETTAAAPPGVVGPHGKLSPGRAKAALSRRAPGPAGEDLVRNTATLMEFLTSKPLTAGNRIDLLVDGPATYKAMLEAIGAARDHVNVEMYTFSDDEVGRKFADLLIKKQKEGVQVNLMYDALGSMGTPDDFFQPLKESGVNVLEFSPVQPAKARKGIRLTHRDHRKVIVVDGRVGFTGGVNISNVYSSGSPTREGTNGIPQGWRDTDVKIEGPAVAQLQRLFIEAWRHQNGPPLADKDSFPSPQGRGDSHGRSYWQLARRKE